MYQYVKSKKYWQLCVYVRLCRAGADVLWQHYMPEIQTAG